RESYTLSLHDALPISHRLYTKKGIEAALPLHFFLERYADAYRAEMSDYVKSLKNGEKVPVDGKDGLSSLKIGLAALKSLKEERPDRTSTRLNSSHVNI